MTPTFSFENIHAWQKAHLFTVMVYQMTKDFPESEQFGLTSQFRRAAISIEANIAEGYKKISKADTPLLQYLRRQSGRMSELYYSFKRFELYLR